ncbi:hypothetical protein OLX02_14975 [Novosphingobium sp. KCTC 2891]|uniref:hypothetical protein n=1 Tax=Novosphingobium sp. KCTC 2891 TaxID=2989730 RepID=UPI002221C843|nr:hypothetical protein [Novosphingobium sp. KCTC 2891]MCW1384124.1 hypothetical protein [Novosphingobium sp. KCTC 2891]
MRLDIGMPAWDFSLGGGVCGVASYARVGALAANDTAVEDAASLLVEALNRLDVADCPVAAAFVDHALALLRLERMTTLAEPFA